MRVIRCDCGFEVTGEGDDDLVSRAQDHARAAHGMDLPPALIVSLARPTGSSTTATDPGP